MAYISLTAMRKDIPGKFPYWFNESQIHLYIVLIQDSFEETDHLIVKFG